MLPERQAVPAREHRPTTIVPGPFAQWPPAAVAPAAAPPARNQQWKLSLSPTSWSGTGAAAVASLAPAGSPASSGSADP
ncbi:hypothetical protein GXW82_31270 [Streptacidiphilus sp. 4-A2]|nr:hypothetical protein [Streptacidiphilus sp. 4-A2]